MRTHPASVPVRPGSTSTRGRLAIALAMVAAAFVPLTSAEPAHAATAQRLAEVHRTAGTSRTGTAIEVSRTSHPAGSRTVVLARADAYADALAGGPLAAAWSAPVLLTGTSGLDADVSAELQRLAPERAFLLGGAGALSEAIVGQLHALGVPDVERVAGSSRTATAAAIGNRLLASHPSDGPVTAYVVEGWRGWPDAVAASALAGTTRSPIFLTSGTALSEETATALRGLDLDRIVIVGGKGVIDGSVEADLLRIHPHVERIAGNGRYATSAAVADAAVEAGANPLSVWIASGDNWPDALVAGPAAVRDGGVLLLSPSTGLAGTPTGTWLAERGASVRDARLVGGAKTLSDQVRDDAAAAAGTVEVSLWSDPLTWNGLVPLAGNDVTIPMGRHVVLDTDTPVLGDLTVHGTLEFARQDLRLQARNIRVHGRLLVGSPGRPFTHNADIVLHPDPATVDNGATDHTDHGTGGLTVVGGRLDLHGPEDGAAWTRLAWTAPAGSSLLRLTRAPNWRAGDQLVVASTTRDNAQTEVVTVASVAGTEVQLTAPLAHDHHGGTETIAGVTVDESAEVGRLNRGIVVRGADGTPDGLGGHLLVTSMHGGHTSEMEGGQPGTARIVGTAFHRMGQRGRLGRYPIHFHLDGPAAGSVVRSAAIHHSNQRCITIHGTQRLTVHDVVAHDAPGHCVFFEDGIESGNVVERTLVVGTRVPSEPLLDTDLAPASFWIQHPTNVLRDNVAAAGTGHGFWYDLPRNPTGPSATTEINPQRAAFGAFEDNVAHGFAKSDGPGHPGTGLFVDDYNPEVPAVLRGVRTWGNSSRGIWGERANVTIADAVISSNAIGYQIHGAHLRDSAVIGTTSNPVADDWSLLGVALYHGAGSIESVRFANFQPYRKGAHAAAIGGATHIQQAFTTLRDVTFDNVAMKVRVTPPWIGDQEGEIAYLGVDDLDGSVLGAPARFVSEPTMDTGGCTQRADVGGYRCDLGTGVAQVMVIDDDNLGPMGETWFTRGTTGARAFTRDDPMREPRAELTVPLGQDYAASFERVLPRDVELILTGRDTGWMDVTLPWPYEAAYVYDGYGAWAYPQSEASAAALVDGDQRFHHDLIAGTLTIRLLIEDPANGLDGWSRLKACADRNCGAEGVGTKRT